MDDSTAMVGLAHGVCAAVPVGHHHDVVEGIGAVGHHVLGKLHHLVADLVEKCPNYFALLAAGGRMPR